MTAPDKDTGVMVTIEERFEKQHLPVVLELKEKVDRGELLSDSDLSFLEEVFADAQQAEALIHKHPEWQPLAAKAMELYAEITEKALKNEQSAS